MADAAGNASFRCAAVCSAVKAERIEEGTEKNRKQETIAAKAGTPTAYDAAARTADCASLQLWPHVWPAHGL